MATRVPVLVDGCAVNRFALVNVSPLRELAGSRFTLAVTPGLEAEYRRGLDHLFVPPYVRALLRALLDGGLVIDEDMAIDGGDARLPTDGQLLELARAAIVITDDAKLYRLRRADHVGLIPWSAVESHIEGGGRLVDLVQRHAELLPGQTSSP